MAENQEKETPLTEVEIRNKLNELATFARIQEGKLIATRELIVELSNIMVELDKVYGGQGLRMKERLNGKLMSLLQKPLYQQQEGILLGIQTVHESLHQLKE